MAPSRASSRRVGFLAAVAALFSPEASSSPLSPPLASLSRWKPPRSKLWKARCRTQPPADAEGTVDGGACDKSYALDEWDFEDDDDHSEYDGSDDESIYSFRGGAASAAGGGGLSAGWRGQNNNRLDVDRGRTKLLRLKRDKMRQVEDFRREKMRQLRTVFREKQRRFQTSLYNLNSRINPEFPRPPYNLWQLDAGPDIGKTTLTGQIFFLNIAMFGLQTLFPQMTALGAKRSDLIMEGRQLYRVLTPVFLHGGIGHLMANSYSLKSMGVNVERAFGRPRLLATYLVSGVAGNVLSAIQSPNPAVGASGAIFGLVGAYYTFLSRNQHLFGRAGEFQKNALIETIGFNLLLGMTNPMIDNWGHVGGFIGGVGMAYLIGPKLYVARVPLGDDRLGAGGFGAGKVVIDRPTITFKTPDAVDDGIFWMGENLRKLGRTVKTSALGLFNGGSQEYFFDGDVDISMGGSDVGGDGTVYRTLKEDGVRVEGSANVTPADGFRQDVSQLDPRTGRQSSGRQRKSYPKAGHSIRPRYGHLYR
ncbi:hypothetical protein ACHAWF_006647 [Thalassiosira exigua]